MDTLVTARPTKTDPALQHDIEQFLYAEAALLDERRFDEWYALLADDLSYQMPVNPKVFNSEQRRGHTAGIGGYVFDEDKHRMDVRVTRLTRGRTVAEEPNSMLRRCVTNVRANPLSEEEVEVKSYFNYTRVRSDYLVDIYTGERIDVLRRAENDYGWEIAKRLINLDHTVHRGGGIGFLF